MFAGNFAPVGWAFCQGQLIPISENDVLFNLIGTTYGGDGQQTFALPNLQSRVPVHQGSGFVIGQAAGVETVTLTTNQMPSHRHLVQTATATQGGGTGTPGGNVIADETGATVNRSLTPIRPMSITPISGRFHQIPFRPRAAASRTTTWCHSSSSISSSRYSASYHRSRKRSIVGEFRCQTRSLRKSASSPAISRPPDGRNVTVRFCRSRRTRRCSRCSAPRTGATASRISPCPTCKARPRCNRVRGRVYRCATSARPAANRTSRCSRPKCPQHGHILSATTTTGTTAVSTNNQLALASAGGGKQSAGSVVNYYSTNNPTTQLSPNGMVFSGGSQPHNNMMPYLGLTFIIALQGVFPARS